MVKARLLRARLLLSDAQEGHDLLKIAQLIVTTMVTAAINDVLYVWSGCSVL